jgi:DNA-directed RNA polymerase subunit M/transcription elongation factor TFIIS
MSMMPLQTPDRSPLPQIDVQALIAVDLCPKCGSSRVETQMRTLSTRVLRCTDCEKRWLEDQRR